MRREDGLDARGLAKLLRPVGVKSKQVRVGAKTSKGYDAKDFADAFARHLQAAAEIVREKKRAGAKGKHGKHPNVHGAGDVPVSPLFRGDPPHLPRAVQHP
jgi:hypothetical protein